MRLGTRTQRVRCAAALALAGAGLATVGTATAGADTFSALKPVTWVSVAARQPARVWVETAAGGWMSNDGGRSFSAPLATAGFQSAQVAQAALLADGKTLIGMPTVWSAQQFSPPRFSSDGGATWHAGKLEGADAHYDFGDSPGFVGEYPVTPDPTLARTAWFCQGNLYVTRDAGRTWTVASPRLKRPWHCAAVAISSGKRHTLLLLEQGTSKDPKRIPGKLLRSADGGRTWRLVKAPSYPQLDYNGHTLEFDPAQPSTVLMVAANGAALGTLYRSTDAGLTWQVVHPAGALRGAVVDEFAFATGGRVLALTNVGDRQTAMFLSSDNGGHWTTAPPLELGSSSPPVFASPLATSGTAFLLGTNATGFWRLAPRALHWVAP